MPGAPLPLIPEGAQAAPGQQLPPGKAAPQGAPQPGGLGKQLGDETVLWDAKSKVPIDPKFAAQKAEKSADAAKPWSWVLPKGDYTANLPGFKGWEGANPKSMLPEGGHLQRSGDEHHIEIPLGGDKRAKAGIGEDGKFKTTLRDGQQLKGQIVGPNIQVERWDGRGAVPRQTAQWNTVVPPPYPIVPGAPLARPVNVDDVRVFAELPPFAVGTVQSLADRPLEIYLVTGEVVSLPPDCSVQLNGIQLKSPHLVELSRSRLVEIYLEG